MRTSGFNHVSVVAKDLEESVAFYRDVFRLEMIPTPNFGFPVQWFRVGDLQLHLFERPDEAPANQHFALVVDDFEGLYARASKEGFLDSQRAGHYLIELPSGTVQLYIRDPAGNLIEVNYPHIEELSESIQAGVKRLADQQPQSEENLRATLFM